MNCPSCGRPLASGAKKCVYCGGGSGGSSAGPAARPQLVVPKGSTRAPKRAIPWGKLLLALLVLGGAAAAFLHPELNAKIRELIARF